MKNTNRYIALALCFTLTLGVFAYRPSEAKAIAGVDDAVVIGALLSAFAGGCGLIFTNNGMTSGELAQGLTDKWNEFNESAENAASSFAAWLGFEDTSALLGALSFSGGKLVIPRAIARKLSDFTTWLTQNLGVTAGSEEKPVFSSSGVANCQFLTWDNSVRSNVYNGQSRSVVLTRISASDYTDYIYDFDLGSPLYSYADFETLSPVSLTLDGKSVALIEWDPSNGGTIRISFYYNSFSGSNRYYNGGVSYVDRMAEKYKGVYIAKLPDGLAFLQYGVRAIDGLEKEYVRVLQASDSRIRFTPDDVLESRLSVFAPSYYKNPTIDLPVEGEEAANPTLSGVGDGTATTIEGLLQQILARLQANTLAPTLDLAGTETGGDTGTDEDAKPYLPYIPQIFEKIKELPGTLSNIWETIKGIPVAIAEKIGAFFTTLWGWLQSIIDAITALPAAIAEKIKALFVPHEGYAAEFVADITATYQGRMGLLTYPFTVLADFVGTVATLEEQEPVLRWDAVEWQNKTIIAAGEYNLKSAVSSAQMQTVYMIYKTVVSGMLVVAFLHLCYKKLKEVQRN
ncbi:MAG: hypothetical protein KHX62_00660 [Firmicutes bacterium]|jgi:hypothetical protein|nr:hypothetical protein [Bacillota bacterium]